MDIKKMIQAGLYLASGSAETAQDNARICTGAASDEFAHLARNFRRLEEILKVIAGRKNNLEVAESLYSSRSRIKGGHGN